jgi:succinate dehydrogenase / fumarate reductase, cytochrome b subunit
MTTSARAMTFYGTSVGKKAVMAVTGLLLFLFVCLHLVGNLQVYGGPEKLDAYAVLLRKIPALLWAARIGLGVLALLHVWTAVQLKLQSWRSRGQRYERFTAVESTISSRWMFWTGSLILAFVVYHLLHLTFGLVVPGFVHLQPYHNLVTGFSLWPISATYIVAMVLLGLHLIHGLFSMFQSVGLNAPRSERWRRGFATAVTITIAAGNLSMPAAILAGWIQ